MKLNLKFSSIVSISKYQSLFLLAALWMNTAGAAELQVHAYPVQWTSFVHLKNLNDIPVLLKSPDYVGNSVTYEKENFPNQIAKTCQDYFRLAHENYSPSNNYEIAMESFFIHACEPLQFLSQAVPAQKSYLRNFNLHKDFKRLPVGLIFPALESSPSEQDMRPLGTVYSDIQLNKKKLDNKNLIEISSKKAGLVANISLLAWGDFNHDGFDDLLIFVGNYDYDFIGTYHSYNFYILTKTSKNGNFLELKM